MARDEWRGIVYALQAIKRWCGGSKGSAQARLVEACASGQVRTFQPDWIAALFADDFSLRPGALNKGGVTSDGRALGGLSGPIPALKWRDATLDGDDLIDAHGKRWQRPEISIEDLRHWLSLKAPIEPQPAQPRGKRGPRATKLEAIAQQMRDAVRNGNMTRERLAAMPEKAMEGTFGASRDTCRKARNLVLETPTE